MRCLWSPTHSPASIAKRIIEFAAQTRLPALYENRELVDDGGLMAYGPNLREMFARAAYYIDKILKGA